MNAIPVPGTRLTRKYIMKFLVARIVFYFVLLEAFCEIPKEFFKQYSAQLPGWDRKWYVTWSWDAWS